jgi:hypothetical protein
MHAPFEVSSRRDLHAAYRLFRLFFETTVALLEDRRSDAVGMADEVLTKWRLRDPCGTYYMARTLAALEHPGALPMLTRVVEGGFHCYPFFARDPWLDSLRADPDFSAIVRVAEAGYRDAAGAFAAAGGEQILGPVQQD